MDWIKTGKICHTVRIWRVLNLFHRLNTDGNYWANKLNCILQGKQWHLSLSITSYNLHADIHSTAFNSIRRKMFTNGHAIETYHIPKKRLQLHNILKCSSSTSVAWMATDFLVLIWKIKFSFIIFQWHLRHDLIHRLNKATCSNRTSIIHTLTFKRN